VRLHQVVGAPHVIEVVSFQAQMLDAPHAGQTQVGEAVGAAVAAIELRLRTAGRAHAHRSAGIRREAQDISGDFRAQL
jgi:hypothetical protein